MIAAPGAIVAVVVAAVVVFPAGGWRPELDAPTAATTAPQIAGLAWELVESPVLAPYPEAVTSAGDLIYALATAPGDADGVAPAGLWSSEDGVSWERASLDGLEIDPQDVALGGGLVYLVGTAPGTSGTTAGIEIAGGDGDGWATTSIDLETRPPPDLDVAAYSYTRVWVAAPDGEVVAVAETAYQLDVTSLVPPEFLDELTAIETNADGIRVLGPNQIEPACSEAAGCPGQEPTAVWAASWSELGIDPARLAQIEVFTGGDDFAPVESPFARSQRLLELTEIDHRVVAITSAAMAAEAATPTMWASDDGTAWDEVGTIPVPANGLLAFGTVGDSIVAVGSDRASPGGVVAISTSGGESWSTVDLSGLLPPPSGERTATAAGVGRSGAIVAIEDWDDEGTGVAHLLWSSDGEAWQLLPAGDLPLSSLMITTLEVTDSRIVAWGYVMKNETLSAVQLVAVPNG
jgi:hypothetical protein